MENITVVKITETREEKLQKYEPTGFAEEFIKLEEQDAADMAYYAYYNSIDKQLAVIIGPTVEIEESETGTRYETTVPVLSGGFLKTGPIVIGALYTRELPYNPPELIDVFYRRFDRVKFAQFRAAIPLDNLYSRIYQDLRNLDPLYADWRLREPAISVLEAPPTTYTTVYGDLVKKLAELGFTIEKHAIPVLYQYFRKFMVHYLKSPAVDYDFFTAKIEMCLIENQIRAEATEREIWAAVMGRICRELVIPFTLTLTPEQKKLLKKRRDILNIFIAPCNHTYKSRDLVLEGDFYVCPHGNPIKCRHYDSDNIIEEFGESLLPNRTNCRICGAELARDPEFVNLAGQGYDIEYDKELRQYIYRKCLMAFNEVEFHAVISMDYLYKLAGNVSSYIYKFIAKNFSAIEKIRGYSENVILSMKEIIAMLYAYSGVFMVVNKNRDIMKFAGERDVQKDVAQNSIKFLLVKLEKYLQHHIVLIKDFKSINLSNAFHAILDEIKDTTIRVPKEYTRFNIKELFIYKFFETAGFDMGKFPILARHKKPVNIHQEIENIFAELLAEFEPYIGKPNKDVFIFSEGFKKWKARMAGARTEYIKYIAGAPVRYRYLTPPTIGKYIKYCPEYISNIYGVDHKHKWLLAKTVKSGEIDITQIALDDTVEYFICSICSAKSGEVGKHNFDEFIENNSKRQFYKFYCPVSNTKTHIGYPCSACGYDSAEFLKKNALPSKYIRPNEITHKFEYYETAKSTKPIEPIFLGGMPKLNYINFWSGLFCNEDITFKELLAGKRGAVELAVPKIIFQLTHLATTLGKIININFMPNKYLEQFIGHEEVLAEICIRINEVLNSRIRFEFEYIKNAFIEIFNMLPRKIAEMYFREIYKNVEISSMSDEKTKAEALMNYKKKIVSDGETETGLGQNDFNYDGFDYDGRNEEMS